MRLKTLIGCTFIAAVLFLTGCTPLRMQVTTYYNPSLQLAGKSFAFYKLTKLHQNTDNQYDYFANLISQKLTSIGMKQTTFKHADYAIVLVYWVGKGQSEIGYQPVYGQTGTQIVSSDTTGSYEGFGNFGDYTSQTNYQSEPTYGVVGESAYQYLMYPYFIYFYILKKDNLTGKPLYRATIITTDVSIAPSVIFTSMLKGYLGIFPGKNGQTRIVTTSLSRQ